MRTQFADLKRLAKDRGVTPMPTCPDCKRQIDLSVWDEHLKLCEGPEKQTPR